MKYSYFIENNLTILVILLNLYLALEKRMLRNTSVVEHYLLSLIYTHNDPTLDNCTVRLTLGVRSHVHSRICLTPMSPITNIQLGGEFRVVIMMDIK